MTGLRCTRQSRVSLITADGGVLAKTMNHENPSRLDRFTTERPWTDPVTLPALSSFGGKMNIDNYLPLFHRED